MSAVLAFLEWAALSIQFACCLLMATCILSISFESAWNVLLHRLRRAAFADALEHRHDWRKGPKVRPERK